MSVLTLQVDEVMRTLSNDGQYPFVVNDKTVDIVRFALNTGFTDVVLDEQTALRVMYQRPGESQVRAQTLTYYDTDGLRNYYDWQLLSADLAEKGTLTVALCILRVDSEVEEWHTTPCQIRVLDTIHTDDSDEGDESITPTVAQRVAVLESVVQSIAGGAPVVVGSTSDMTDTDKIYVLSTDGYWYYYDGAEWQQGGEYGAVATDSTLTQPGVPADAKAVGDALAEAMTGEALEDGEDMKFVLSSKYDDFKLVDGYGFFDAKELIDNSVDFNRPMSPQADDNNVIFRWSDQYGYFKLGEGGVIEGLFSPDYPMKRPNISSRSMPELESALKSFEPGYWVEKVTTREERYFAVPKDAYGDSETLGTYISNYLDGSIGIKMDESKIVEYDPSDALLATTSGVAYGESSVDGTVYYTGFLSFTWSSVFDFSYNVSALRRMYSTYGLLFDPSYPKENVRFQGNDRLWYKIKKDKVGGANNLANIKDYLVNVKHLKFYYVQD